MQADERGVATPAAGQTTIAVQRHLDALAGDAPADPILRSLLGRSVGRLERLCRKQLRGGYPRLTLAPTAVETGDVLAAIVERLLRATREMRPQNVRQFFGLANKHIRWELNELARARDSGPRRSDLSEEIAQPGVTDSGVSPAVLRLLAAIEELPEENREVFDLVRVQGLSHAEAAEIAGVSTKTIQRRLREAMLLLAERVGFIEPAEGTTPA